MFGTDRLEPREAAWLRDTMGVAPASADPARTQEAVRAGACDMMLGDCLWHVYAMIGKLDRRIYLLSRPGPAGGVAGGVADRSPG